MTASGDASSQSTSRGSKRRRGAEAVSRRRGRPSNIDPLGNDELGQRIFALQPGEPLWWPDEPGTRRKYWRLIALIQAREPQRQYSMLPCVAHPEDIRHDGNYPAHRVLLVRRLEDRSETDIAARFNWAGKYDAECQRIFVESQAGCVALIVIGGERGDGFAVKGEPRYIERLPEFLEDIARQLRAQGDV